MSERDLSPEPAHLAFNEATRLCYQYAGSKKRANEIMQQVLIILKYTENLQAELDEVCDEYYKFRQLN